MHGKTGLLLYAGTKVSSPCLALPCVLVEALFFFFCSPGFKVEDFGVLARRR